MPLYHFALEREEDFGSLLLLFSLRISLMLMGGFIPHPGLLVSLADVSSIFALVDTEFPLHIKELDPVPRTLFSPSCRFPPALIAPKIPWPG